MEKKDWLTYINIKRDMKKKKRLINLYQHKKN